MSLGAGSAYSFSVSGMSVSTDLLVLLVLSVLTLIAAVRHWQTTKATPNHIHTPTEKSDDDPNKGRRFGGEQPTFSGEHD